MLKILAQLAFAIAVTLLVIAEPANAHHAIGGETPDNFIDGFLSGVAHPVIGIDHFAFVVAIGLLAALKKQGGIFIPVIFVLTTIVGTVIHLLSLDLPIPEIVISASVLSFGILLAMKDVPNLVYLIGSAAAAGIFHGYAYGEAIVGAQMTPLVAYLAGFALIQLAVAFLAFGVGKFTFKMAEQPSLNLRFAGFVISGAGAAFLSSAILG
ncbi:MAG: HupE/UreJ family protein [Prochloraceae cyanobacterium]|nr:HupE/UreJ family protein [Prochloraceae cyanobacterium]